MEQSTTPASGNPESLRKELVESFTKFEKSFRNNYPIFWLITLLAPFIVTIVVLVVIGMTMGWAQSWKLISHAFLTFFVFGRFIILTGMEGEAHDAYKITMLPGELFWMVTYMDFMVAMFVTFHMGLLFRIPYVGPKIALLVWDGKFVMDTQPWIRRVAFLGLVLFVIFPTSTTGSIGGSIFGRLLGLSRLMTVAGVLAGSLLGNGIMWNFAKIINQYVGVNNIWTKVAGGAILVVLVILLEMRYRAVKNKYLQSEGIEQS